MLTSELTVKRVKIYCKEGTSVVLSYMTASSFLELTKPINLIDLPDCKKDLHSDCGLWAGVGECEKNPPWMIPNCCVSCKYHQAPKGWKLIRIFFLVCLSHLFPVN